MQPLRPIDTPSIGKTFFFYKWTTTDDHWNGEPAVAITDPIKTAYTLQNQLTASPSKIGMFCIPGFVACNIEDMPDHFGLGGSDLEHGKRACLITGKFTYKNTKTKTPLTITDHHQQITIPIGSPAYQGDPSTEEIIILEPVKLLKATLAELSTDGNTIDLYHQGKIIHQLSAPDGGQW